MTDNDLVDLGWGVFDYKAEIRKQREEGAAVIAPLSMLRCSECGNLLDAYGRCDVHGLLDPEASDVAR